VNRRTIGWAKQLRMLTKTQVLGGAPEVELLRRAEHCQWDVMASGAAQSHRLGSDASVLGDAAGWVSGQLARVSDFRPVGGRHGSGVAG
jgi:hypothetical protein